MSIGTDKKLVTLGENNFIKFDLTGLQARANCSYKYKLDPAFVADIGKFNFDIRDVNFYLNGSVFFNDQDLL